MKGLCEGHSSSVSHWALYSWAVNRHKYWSFWIAPYLNISPSSHTHLGRGWASEASPANYLSVLAGGGVGGVWSPALQTWCSGCSAPVSSPHWPGAKLFIQGPGSQAGWACSHLKGERW